MGEDEMMGWTLESSMSTHASQGDLRQAPALVPVWSASFRRGASRCSDIAALPPSNVCFLELSVAVRLLKVEDSRSSQMAQAPSSVSTTSSY